MELTQVLMNACSQELGLRQEAENNLKQFEANNYANYLGYLSAELGSPQKPAQARQLAGLCLKNALTSRDEQQDAILQERWVVVDEPTRNKIKSLLMETLGAADKIPRRSAALAISKIARIEVPRGLWSTVVPTLCDSIQKTSSLELMEGSYQALGYVCEDCPQSLEGQSGFVLTAIAKGLDPSQTHVGIKLAATVALSNCLQFISDKFVVKDTRDLIIKMIFQAVQVEDESIRVAAYQCLVSIASKYYNYISDWILPIFELTQRALETEVESCVLQAIEFWATVCDEENKIMDHIEDCKERDVAPTLVNHEYMKKALPLVQHLLVCLTQQAENVDDDEWNRSKAAATALTLIASTTRDDVVDHVLPFVYANIQSENWRLKEASILAFGSILDGPDHDKLLPIVQTAFPLFLAHMKDEHDVVKDTAAWTIGAVCDIVPEVINKEVLPALMKTIIEGLQDTLPSVANHMCYAVHSLAQATQSDDDSVPSPLAPYFSDLLTGLLATTEREDVTEGNLMSSAWSALHGLLEGAGPNTTPVIIDLLPHLMHRLNQVCILQVFSNKEKEKQAEMQGLICGTLIPIISKVDDSVLGKYVDELMMLLFQVLDTQKTGGAVEETFYCIESIVSRTGRHFMKYMKTFLPYIQVALANFRATSIVSVAVGMVGNLARALEGDVFNFTDDFMNALLGLLQQPVLDRDVRPYILGVFGDIAFAIGGHFQRYMAPVMDAVNAACATQLAEGDNDIDHIIWINSLRENILAVYTALLTGLGEQTPLLIPYVPLLMQFLEVLARDSDKDEVVVKAAVGVIGDLATRLGTSNQIAPLLRSPAVEILLNNGLQLDESNQKVVSWARNAVQQLL